MANKVNNLEKKELLIKVATDLFAKKGFADTSIRDIAKAAKTNAALIYYYFNDKEEILYNIVERAARRPEVILKEIQSSEPDPLECLKKMIVRQIRFSSDSWKETKVMVSEGNYLHGQAKTASTMLQRGIYDAYMSQLQKLKESNILSDVNLTVANFVIFGAINWFYRWFKDGGPLNEEQIANEMIKIIFSGLLRKC